MTDLYDAAKDGDLATCRALIEHGADVNAKDNDGWTPLHVGTYWEHLEICELLMEPI